MLPIKTLILFKFQFFLVVLIKFTLHIHNKYDGILFHIQFLSLFVNICGLMLCYLSIYFNIFSLKESKYFNIFFKKLNQPPQILKPIPLSQPKWVKIF